MTPKEFKAWFEGFTEAMNGLPTEPQWAKIKARVAQIDGNPVSYPVFVDRYWPRPRQWWETPQYEPYRVYSAASSGAALSGRTTPIGQESKTLSCRGSNDGLGQVSFEAPAFDSAKALFAAGKADFDDLRAA
jgi:hypothetical protein